VFCEIFNGNNDLSVLNAPKNAVAYRKVSTCIVCSTSEHISLFIIKEITFRKYEQCLLVLKMSEICEFLNTGYNFRGKFRRNFPADKIVKFHIANCDTTRATRSIRTFPAPSFLCTVSQTATYSNLAIFNFFNHVCDRNDAKSSFNRFKNSTVENRHFTQSRSIRRKHYNNDNTRKLSDL